MIRELSISVLWKHAGLISVCWCCRDTAWNLHLFPQRSCWSWGYEVTWYDGPWPMFGAGPLFLLAWGYSPKGD